MNERDHQEASYIRSLSSEEAATFIIDKYPHSHIVILKHRSWKRSDQIRLARHFVLGQVHATNCRSSGHLPSSGAPRPGRFACHQRAPPYPPPPRGCPASWKPKGQLGDHSGSANFLGPALAAPRSLQKRGNISLYSSRKCRHQSPMRTRNLIGSSIVKRFAASRALTQKRRGQWHRSMRDSRRISHIPKAWILPNSRTITRCA